MSISFFDSTTITLREVVNPLILLFILFVVSILVLSPVIKRIHGRILLILLLIYGMMSINSMLMAFHLRQIYIFTLWTYFPLILYISPLCFLYVKSLVTEKFILSKYHLYHFAIPLLFTFFSLVVNIVIVLADIKSNYVLYDRAMSLFIYLQGLALFYIVVIQFVLYIILCIKEFFSHKRNIEHFFSYSEGITLNWVALFILGMALYFIIFILSNNEFFFIAGISDTAYDFAHFGITIFFIFLIGSHGAKQHNIFEINNKERENKIEDLSPEKGTAFMHDDERKNELKELIVKLMEEEKIFLNNTLTIDLLSEKLSSNRTYVSNVINECFQMNFYTFVNKYRIEEAIKKLQDTSFKNYSIEGIAGLCGFTSRSSFNIAFKKFTGKTPSDYKF